MAFYFRDGESVEEAVQRIALEQLDKAVAELKSDELPRHEQVHQVRKRCKKIRGLLRLVRPSLGETYKRENAHYRDAARRLSDLRDSHTLQSNFEKLLRHFEGQLDGDAFSPVREMLQRQRDEVLAREPGVEQRLAVF